MKKGFMEPEKELLLFYIKYTIPFRLLGEKKWNLLATRLRFKKIFGRAINLSNPQTLNEKLQWLKLYAHSDLQTMVADKYTVRNYLAQFGEEHLIPLLFCTDNWREITYETLPEEPCIVKCSTGSANHQIIRDKDKIDIDLLRRKCKTWLSVNYYHRNQEWQYKNAKPRILVEKLITDKKGHIPNDYKLFYINGELQFIYCSIDREGENYRNIYSPAWKRMPMEWVPRNEHTDMRGSDIPQPKHFGKMTEIGRVVAKNFACVRVDFYETEERLYYGEITLHHGSGYDTFLPEENDLKYGKVLDLNWCGVKQKG